MLAVSPGVLQFPSVTVGDTASVVFSVSNTGLEPLHVSSIRPPFGELRLDRPAPQDLRVGIAVLRALTLVATQPRTDDTLVIESNDPLASTLSVPLLVRRPRARLREPCPGITRPGAARGLVHRGRHARPGRTRRAGTLFFRIAGASAAFDSVALTPLATDFIGAVPARAVTESGVEYYVRVENSDFHATQPPGAPSSSFTQAVEPPLAMAALPRPTSGAGFLAGREIEVEVELPAGAVFVSGRIHFREGGAAVDESDTIVIGALGRPVGKIPARVVGPRGVEYWVEARTLTRDLRFPEFAPVTQNIRTRIQGLAEPSEHAAGRYRLLSLPVDFGPDFAGSLDAILVDQLGTYDPVEWRAFRWLPASLQSSSCPPREPPRSGRTRRAPSGSSAGTPIA